MLSREEELQRMKEKNRQMMENEKYDALQRQYERALMKQVEEERARAAQQAMKIQPYKYYDTMNINGVSTFSTTTGNTHRDHGEVVTEFTNDHGNGFWSAIKIHEDDFIFYRLFRTKGRLRRWWYMAGFGSPKDINGGGWEYIGSQGHKDALLEAQLGKTYLKIDELIEAEIADEEHKKFIRGIADTDPENLKMIAGLKKLDDGMKEPLDEPMTATKVKKAKYTAKNITVASTPSIKWDQGASLNAGAQEIIRVDPEGEVSLGEKMVEAVQKAMDQKAS